MTTSKSETLGPTAQKPFPRHTFADPAILAHALTHRSAEVTHNERLEFLGDAVLGFVIADLLYLQFPDLDEGRLTRARAALVNRRALAALARETGIGERLKLGEGELRSGGRQRDSILANAVEAVLGAVYLDGGVAACRVEIEELYRERLANLSIEDTGKDAKTRLQELLQARRAPLPEYTVTAIEGVSPNQRFIVTCAVCLLEYPTQGEGRSRRLAEQAAAASALKALESTTKK